VIKNSDLVILAAPVSTIKEKARRISEIINNDCIVFDVASTKEEIVSELDPLFPRFVGAHPIAGSEKKGIKNAKQGLFKNTVCILTPSNKTDSKALNKVKRLWFELGAKVVLIKPQSHDRILSFVSHLPHLTAFALMNSIPGDCLNLVPNSLKDSTRVAASDSVLWSDIFFSNKKNVLTAVKVLEEKIMDIKRSLMRNDRKKLIKILDHSKARRELLNASNST
jgi:prephenate dehydrogenase